MDFFLALTGLIIVEGCRSSDGEIVDGNIYRYLRHAVRNAVLSVSLYRCMVLIVSLGTCTFLR